MNDRTRALEVLRNARDLLAQRLTERILDSAEEILADARGESYMGDIDTVYEQVGMRMVHLSQMISHLPPEVEPVFSAESPPHPSQDYFTVATDPSPSADAFSTDTMPGIVGPVYISTPALPAPAVHGDEETAETATSFQAFAAQVYSGDLRAAGLSLSWLLGISERSGLKCARHFAEKLQLDPRFLRQAMQLRAELQAGGQQGALVLLHECFGLAGLDAVTVLDHLRQRGAE